MNGDLRTIQRKIAGAFIFSGDGKLLLGKSRKGGVYKDQWIVPGGGIEEHETPEEAMAREILEEVGIDVSSGHVEHLESGATGLSEKVLRETGERVMVQMTFYDYKVTLEQKAEDIRLALDDDIAETRWFAADELGKVPLSGPTEELLLKFGYIK
ncbi:NUDIX hydrolase [Candidatus Saccharibacteria bacterium]|nr:NUDIX hydrolase [Candidatus Saccharibacteria bacterium]